MTTYPVKTCLWFDSDAAAAAELYTALIPDSQILRTSHYGPENEYGATGSVLEVEFRLGAQVYVALNGGPHFRHTPAASIQVYCPDQAEVDRLWGALIEGGGEESMCGWLVDRFGLSWQIIPTRLAELAADPDPDRASRVVAAMLTMRRIVIADLEAAAAREKLMMAALAAE